MNSYEELTPDMREQVDATISLHKDNMFPHLAGYQEEYMREHLSNLVQSCIYLAKSEHEKRIATLREKYKENNAQRARQKLVAMAEKRQQKKAQSQ